MRVLLDTSLLIAASVEGHPAHAEALGWLQRVKGRADEGLVAADALAEMYAVLTTLPVRPRIPPAIALQLIQENVLEACEVVYPSGEDYRSLIQHLADSGIIGGATYDALLLHVAWKARVDRVVTLNPTDFRRAYSPLADRIISPLEG